MLKANIIAILVLAVILAAFLIGYIFRRNNKTECEALKPRTLGSRKKISTWVFISVFGLFFIGIFATCILTETHATREWVKTPAVISKIEGRSNRNDMAAKWVYISYQYEGQIFEDIYTRMRIKGNDHRMTVGKQIVILVNPLNPSQIDASPYFSLVIFFVLTIIGMLLFLFGVYEIIMTRAGKSNWRTADEAPVIPIVVENTKKGYVPRVVITLFIVGWLSLTYFIASTPIFIGSLCFAIFFVVYGLVISKKNKKDE